MSIYIGIDPGLGGAVAILADDGTLLYATRTPIISGVGTAKRHYDIPQMAQLVKEWASVNPPTFVAVEKVAAMPHDGVTSSFRFGQGYGIWQGIMAALDLPIIDVRPQMWQKQLLEGMPRGKAVKTSAVTRAKALWPTIPIKFKADWGMADAALIGETARRNHYRPHP